MLHLSLPAVFFRKLIIMEWTSQKSWPSDIHLALVKQVPAKGNNRSSILMPLVLSVPGWRLTMLNFFSGCPLLQDNPCWVLVTILSLTDPVTMTWVPLLSLVGFLKSSSTCASCSFSPLTMKLSAGPLFMWRVNKIPAMYGCWVDLMAYVWRQVRVLVVT